MSQEESPTLSSILPPPALPSGELKRRRLAFSFSSPRLAPAASPDLLLPSETDVIEYWTCEQLNPASPILRAVSELKQYLSEFQTRAKDPFWHRKSRKPVLSVLVSQQEDGSLSTYRGMNTEVSLPAGSFCAERAAITRAASDFCQVSSIVAIATLDPLDNFNPLWPCEVCQSWLSKMRVQNPDINVIAFSSTTCDSFSIAVNGEFMLPPRTGASPGSSETEWLDRVELAEGTIEYPWEAKEVIYVDGAWNFLHAGHQHILKQARSKGTHLIVGVHSDQTLTEVFGSPGHEPFETRVGRILQNRYVSSALKDAPWTLTPELITSLKIHKVVTGSVTKIEDGGKVKIASDPYKIARDMGILEVVTSGDDTTELRVYETHVARAKAEQLLLRELEVMA